MINKQPEALRLADELVAPIKGFLEPSALETSAELRRLQTRVQELEASQAQRVPLTRKQINECSRDAQIAFFMDKHPTYEVALTREVERLLGITQEKQG